MDDESNLFPSEDQDRKPKRVWALLRQLLTRRCAQRTFDFAKEYRSVFELEEAIVRNSIVRSAWHAAREVRVTGE